MPWSLNSAACWGSTTPALSAAAAAWGCPVSAWGCPGSAVLDGPATWGWSRIALPGVSCARSSRSRSSSVGRGGVSSSSFLVRLRPLLPVGAVLEWLSQLESVCASPAQSTYSQHTVKIQSTYSQHTVSILSTYSQHEHMTHGAVMQDVMV